MPFVQKKIKIKNWVFERWDIIICLELKVTYLNQFQYRREEENNENMF